MPERIKLTEKVLRDAEPVPGRDYQIFDMEVRGFAACIYRGGGRAFTLDYRHAGRQRRMTFGRWPEWSGARPCQPPRPRPAPCPAHPRSGGLRP